MRNLYKIVEFTKNYKKIVLKTELLQKINTSKYTWNYGIRIYSEDADIEITFQDMSYFCGGVFVSGLMIEEDIYDEGDKRVQYFYDYLKEVIQIIKNEDYGLLQYITADAQDYEYCVEDFIRDNNFKQIFSSTNPNSSNDYQVYVLDLYED